MTQQKNEPVVVKKLVLFFDICSSTSILEDLLASEEQIRWRNLLIGLKTFLCERQELVQFEIYKFIGDGWILLVDPTCDPKKLFAFLTVLCDRYETLFNKKVAPVLSTKVGNTGMTFGLAKGSLMRVVMNSQVEYMGQPLNLAARLQAAIKDRDRKPQRKVLMAKNVYEDLKASLGADYRVDKVTRQLRNVAGGRDYQLIKLWLFDPKEQRKFKVVPLSKKVSV